MAIQFAARKHGWRQTDKGYVLTLLIDPTDQWQEIALAALGESFGVAMVAIDPATGQSVPEQKSFSSCVTTPKAESGGVYAVDIGGGRQAKKHWHEMSRAQQAGILCADKKFQDWVVDQDEGPEHASEFVRWYCRVESRSQIDSAPGAPALFDKLVMAYRSDTGQMAEQRR